MQIVLCQSFQTRKSTAFKNQLLISRVLDGLKHQPFRLVENVQSLLPLHSFHKIFYLYKFIASFFQISKYFWWLYMSLQINCIYPHKMNASGSNSLHSWVNFEISSITIQTRIIITSGQILKIYHMWEYFLFHLHDHLVCFICITQECVVMQPNWSSIFSFNA